MPTNVGAEYVTAEMEYSHASTVDEKIKALQKMYATVPKHKGTEHLRQEIKTKIAKLKEKKQKQLEKKSKGKSFSIKKEGAATICIIGPPNSGKSLLLNKLTNSKAKVAEYGFTTKRPEIGIMKYKGLKLQTIEVPSIFEGYSESERGPQFLSIIRQADLAVIVTDRSDIDFLFREMDNANIALKEDLYGKDESWVSLSSLIVINKKDIIDSNKVFQDLCKYYKIDRIEISAFDEEDIKKLKDELWKNLNLIKVYTKEPGKKAKKDEPICLKKGAVIEDMAVHIHKDFIKKFRFARVWGSSAKFNAQMCGLRHRLKDEDIVEVHLK
ncbi:TGS domain-containing protein [Candidatus Woesearchaeota archaeon]|nr:TGS domain-containing protein [Candidatus Woesearchaeota archaeon]